MTLPIGHGTRAGRWKRSPYYLGHLTQRGTSAIQMTIRSTQVSRAQVREKLRLLHG
jgi:hypothetical protein